uniref:CSON014496 protein n=1 Tax=Culicoides sonorensis TaxID=179676 RepID=A0A336MAL2_CULSO
MSKNSPFVKEPQKWIPLQLSWTLDFNPSIFDCINQQLDNFTLMMSELYLSSDLAMSRVLKLIINLFEIHNKLFCSTEETRKTVSSIDVFKVSDQIIGEIGEKMTKLDVDAFKACSNIISLDSQKILKYLTATSYGLKAEMYFIMKDWIKGNECRIEMFKSGFENELFELLDLADMIIGHCSLLIRNLWGSSLDALEVISQIDHLLLFSKNLLDCAKLEDDIDGIKYQNLRKFWHLIGVVNEAWFIESAWKKLSPEEIKNYTVPFKCHKITHVDYKSPPKILCHGKIVSAQDYLTRKQGLEEHKTSMMKYGHFKVNSEKDSCLILIDVLKYLELACKTVKENNCFN